MYRSFVVAGTFDGQASSTERVVFSKHKLFYRIVVSNVVATSHKQLLNWHVLRTVKYISGFKDLVPERL